MTTPLLDWAAANSWLAFWCAWPIALTLIVASWMFAEVMTRGMNLVVQLANLASNTLVLCLRGYAPQSEEAHEDDDNTPPATT